MEVEYELTGVAPPPPMIRRLVRGTSLDSTLRQVAQLLEQRQLRLFGKVDHGKAAPASDKLPPTVNIYFGSPAKGTPLMRERPELAARMPLCLSVHQRAPDELQLTLVNPFAGDQTLQEPALQIHETVEGLLNDLGATPAPASPVGRWEVVACQLHGRWLPVGVFREYIFHIAPDRYHIEWSGLSFPAWVGSYPKSYYGTLQWPDASEPSPTQVDMVPGSGPHRGKTMLGLYQLDNDILKMVFGLPDHPRPRTFAAGAGEVYEVWRRL